MCCVVSQYCVDYWYVDEGDKYYWVYDDWCFEQNWFVDIKEVWYDVYFVDGVQMGGLVMQQQEGQWQGRIDVVNQQIVILEVLQVDVWQYCVSCQCCLVC